MGSYDIISHGKHVKDLSSAFFDIDHTIILPKNGKKLYSKKDNFEWEYMYDNTIQRIRDTSKTHSIYFVTNQLKYDSIIKARITEMMKELNIPSTALISTDRDIYRKPGIGLLSIDGFIPNITKESFHVGDALGREGDFSDDDLWFAIHAGLKVYSPEEYFDINFDPSLYGPIEYIKSKPIDTYLINVLRNIHDDYNVVMLIGLPGSGKSAIRKWYENNYSNVGVFNNDEKKTADDSHSFYVIDNINLTEKQRSSYPEFIYELKIATIFTDLSPKDCIRGVKYRTTIEGGIFVPDVAIYTANKYRNIPSKLTLHLRSRPVLTKNFPAYLLN